MTPPQEEVIRAEVQAILREMAISDPPKKRWWDSQAVVMVALAVATGLVWAVRLEGRINTQDQATADIKADLHDIKADIKTLLSKGAK